MVCGKDSGDVEASTDQTEHMDHNRPVEPSAYIAYDENENLHNIWFAIPIIQIYQVD